MPVSPPRLCANPDCGGTLPRGKAGPLCRECADSQSSARPGQIVVVCGPPGAGKTTWVQERIDVGREMVLDIDRLWVAITGLPFHVKPRGLLRGVLEMRDALLDWVARTPHVSGWVIATAPRPGERDELERELCAKVVVLEVPPAVCSVRIRADPSRAGDIDRHERLVAVWWAEYRRRPTDWINGERPETVSPYVGERRSGERRQAVAERGEYGAAWRKIRPVVIERDRGPDGLVVCQICGVPITKEEEARGVVVVDHITPRREGGSDHPSNLRSVHSGCNTRRHIKRGEFFGKGRKWRGER